MPSPVSPPSRPVASSKALIRKKGGGLVKNKRTNMEGAHKFFLGGEEGEKDREVVSLSLRWWRWWNSTCQKKLMPSEEKKSHDS